MPQFDPTFYLAQLVWLILCFGILWGVVHWKVMPAFAKLKNWRKIALENLINEAKSIHQKTETILQENQRVLEATRREATALIQGAKNTGEERLRKCLEEVRSMYAYQVQELQKRLEKEKESFRVHAKETAPELAGFLLKRYGWSKTKRKTHG